MTSTIPQRVLDQTVVARLRVRRDRPGALVALEDGRYAVTGPLLIAGSRDDVTDLRAPPGEHRRPRRSAPGCRPIVGALAIDIFDAASSAR